MRRLLSRLLQFLTPYWGLVVLAALLGALTVGSSVGLLATSAFLISSAALHPSVAELQVAIVGVRFFGIARGFLRYAERYVSHTVTFRLLAELRVWFYRALEPLAPARLLHYRGGDLLSRIVADIETLESFYLRVVAPPATALLVAALVWGWLLSFDLTLANVLLLILVLTGAGLPLLAQWRSRSPAAHLVRLRSQLQVEMVDAIQGLPDLLAFGRAEDRLERAGHTARVFARAQELLVRVTALHTAAGTLLSNLGLWIVLLLGIALVDSGRIDAVYLAALALGALASFEAVSPLPQAAQNLTGALEAARRLFQIVDVPPVVVDVGAPLPLPSEYDLCVTDLRFRYAPEEPLALDGISFRVPSGGSLAIVGPSGAGKTTLVHLLLRFWEYQEGEIRLGGHDLRRYAQEQVRQTIGVISQNTYLFNATIRENLLLARPSATQAEIIAAARQAQIHAFVESLPQRYETPIGERGLALSGGERQRLSIARALLRNTPMLLLDEPAANLDSVTAAQLGEALRAAMAGRTTILITHQLSGLERFDQIVVLSKGRVVEVGTHADLLRAGGLYRRLSDLQSNALEFGP